MKKEYEPKFKAAAEGMKDILTADQKKAREDAMKAARDAGKKGRDVFEAAKDAVKLTDDQKAKLKASSEQMQKVGKEIHEKIDSILTADQKEILKKAREGHMRRPGADKK